MFGRRNFVEIFTEFQISCFCKENKSAALQRSDFFFKLNSEQLVIFLGEILFSQL